MRGARRDFSIDVIRISRECRWRIWFVWQSRLRVKVLTRSVRVQKLLVRVNRDTAIHAETASGTQRKVRPATRVTWIACQGKCIILWLTVEIGAILEWDWNMGGLRPAIHLGLNKISWRKTWGQVYCVLRSDMRTWMCKWFRFRIDRGFDAIVTARLSIMMMIYCNSGNLKFGESNLRCVAVNKIVDLGSVNI